MFYRSLVLPVATVVQVINGAAAQSCSAQSSLIETQADINAISNCPDLGGYVGISVDFKGEFFLPGVKVIGRLSAGNPGASHSTPTMGTPRVTTVDMPDLETAESINFSGVPYLDTFSMPKLKSANYFGLGNMESLTELSLPALETLGGNTLFSGPFESINLSSLKSATSIWIESSGGLDCAALGAQLESISWPTGEGYGLDCVSELNAYHSETTSFSNLFPQSAGVVHATSSAPAPSLISTEQVASPSLTAAVSNTASQETEYASLSVTIYSSTTSTAVVATTIVTPASVVSSVASTTGVLSTTAAVHTTIATSAIENSTTSSISSSFSSVPTLITSGTNMIAYRSRQSMIGLLVAACFLHV